MAGVLVSAGPVASPGLPRPNVAAMGVLANGLAVALVEPFDVGMSVELRCCLLATLEAEAGMLLDAGLAAAAAAVPTFLD